MIIASIDGTLSASLVSDQFSLSKGGRVTTWIGTFAALMLSTGAGVSFVIQQAVNADLRASIGSAAWAGFVSYLGGTLCMTILAVVLREAAPALADIDRSHWWAWTGGLFGAVYIAISIFLIPRLGAVFFVALLVAGQRCLRRWRSTISARLACRSIP